ncbi:MAG: hypothetical protein J6P66_07770 [Bacteroidaceae bacterium]|nr:hypothetical protein [Bacteroidaceae bacterium]
MMNIKIRHILIVALLAFMPAVSAQNGIEIKTPERITRMLESIPATGIPTAGQFRCPELSGTLQFYTEAYSGVTIQVGARLFSDAVRTSYDPVIISFVERLWVELLLRKTTASQSSLLKEYGVRMVLGGYPLGSGSFKQLGQALDVINNLSSLSITTGGNEIDMFMRDKAGSTLHIYIPASRDLLFSYDKKEHEEIFINDMLNNRAGYKQALPESTVFTNTDNGLLVTGGECYMIDSLRNDVFYTKDKIIVFSSEYPEESMRNLMMSAVDLKDAKNFYLDITPHTYNRDIKGFRTTMSRFMGFVQQQGYRFYTGDAGRNGDKCQCLLAMYHPVYNYLHLLSVSFTPDQLESEKAETIKADLSTFIPQHNIKNLFQEK